MFSRSYSVKAQLLLAGECTVHGSRHKRKHPKGRRKVGRNKRRMMRKRRSLRTNG